MYLASNQILTSSYQNTAVHLPVYTYRVENYGGKQLKSNQIYVGFSRQKLADRKTSNQGRGCKYYRNKSNIQSIYVFPSWFLKRQFIFFMHIQSKMYVSYPVGSSPGSSDMTPTTKSTNWICLTND